MSISREESTSVAIVSHGVNFRKLATATALPIGIAVKFSGANVVAAAVADTDVVIGYTATDALDGFVLVKLKGNCIIKANVTTPTLGMLVNSLGTATNGLPNYALRAGTDRIDGVVIGVSGNIAEIFVY